MNFIKPNWSAPNNVHAFTTTRLGGVSQAPYDSFNLADHVGEDEAIVAANRAILKTALSLPNEPIWLEQTHSTIVLPATPNNRGKKADAAFTNAPNQVCAIATADCLPILLCNKTGTHVAAIHAGWRGMAHGIIENTVTALQTKNLCVWLGPAIGPSEYEVGEEVKQEFISADPNATTAFTPSPQGRWLANLYQLARLRLQRLGINEIFGDDYCTFTDKNLFYSYRRDGAKTGRMVSLIWFTA